jgi:phosphoglucomutase
MRQRGMQKAGSDSHLTYDALNCRYNTSNGGPAPEKLTSAIYEGTKTISHYYIAADLPDVDLSKPGSHTFMVQHGDDTKFGQFTVEVRC